MSLLTNFRSIFSAAFSALKNGAILGGRGNWWVATFGRAKNISARVIPHGDKFQFWYEISNELAWIAILNEKLDLKNTEKLLGDRSIRQLY